MRWRDHRSALPNMVYFRFRCLITAYLNELRFKNSNSWVTVVILQMVTCAWGLLYWRTQRTSVPSQKLLLVGVDLDHEVRHDFFFITKGKTYISGD